jgi:hypothetical protein
MTGYRPVNAGPEDLYRLIVKQLGEELEKKCATNRLLAGRDAKAHLSRV